MDAMILAAGRGERLRPLTDSIPKPLIAVGDHRLIEYHLLNLARSGFNRVVVNVSHLAEIVMDTLGDGNRYGIHIDYSVEPGQALGTAGGIARALGKFHSDQVLVVNGDVYTDMVFPATPLAQGIDAHLVLVPSPPHHIDGDFSLHGNKAGLAVHGTVNHTFSGVGIYRKSLFADSGSGFGELGPILKKLASAGRVTAELYRGNWIDVGTKQRLESARMLSTNTMNSRNA